MNNSKLILLNVAGLNNGIKRKRIGKYMKDLEADG